MRRYLYPILIVLVSVGFYFWEHKLDSDYYKDLSKEATNHSTFDFLPKGGKGQIVKHAYYTLKYSEEHEQSLWVAYELKEEHLSSNQFKRPYFEVDPLVKTQAASWRNYKKSGYDRGHLCPAGDRRFSKKAFDETFLTSNISPQIHDFNAGVWNKLEQKVRHWVKNDKQLFIVTGPIFEDSKKTIGSEQVTVPTHFFKAILKYDRSNSKSIAFVLPHKKGIRDFKNYTISIDELEKKLDYDLFSSLEDKLEVKLESSDNKWMWRF